MWVGWLLLLPPQHLPQILGDGADENDEEDKDARTNENERNYLTSEYSPVTTQRIDNLSTSATTSGSEQDRSLSIEVREESSYEEDTW